MDTLSFTNFGVVAYFISVRVSTAVVIGVSVIAVRVAVHLVVVNVDVVQEVNFADLLVVN